MPMNAVEVDRMRTLLFLAICVTLLSARAVRADGERTAEGISLGIHCNGSEWGHATPTLRWRPGPAVGVDFTPSYSYWNGGPHNYEYDLHLEVGYAPTVCANGPLLLALRVATGYTTIKHSSGGPLRHKETTYRVDLTAGPDLEFFLPSLPQLSIGIHSVIRVRFEETHSWSRYDDQIIVDMGGEWLTMRYYF
jgi:hypothetical protein